MDTISVKGEKYIKAGLIAKELGYTPDYVGQLCRSGQVLATLVGRGWYVSESSIRAHKKSRYRSNLSKSHSAVKQVIEKNFDPQTPRYLKNSSPAVYQNDEEPLFPTLDKRPKTEPEVLPIIEEVISTPEPEPLLVRENPPVRAINHSISRPVRPMVRVISAKANRPVVQSQPRESSPVVTRQSTRKVDKSTNWGLLMLLLAVGLLWLSSIVAFEYRIVTKSSTLPADSHYQLDIASGVAAIRDSLR